MARQDSHHTGCLPAVAPQKRRITVSLERARCPDCWPRPLRGYLHGMNTMFPPLGLAPNDQGQQDGTAQLGGSASHMCTERRLIDTPGSREFCLFRRRIALPLATHAQQIQGQRASSGTWHEFASRNARSDAKVKSSVSPVWFIILATRRNLSKQPSLAAKAGDGPAVADPPSHITALLSRR